ncbi:MAG: uroporphyrinogen decarboxylase family protein [Armatimonadota bacterium]
MTLREHVLAAVRGENTDQIPLTCYDGLLPDGGEDIENLGLVTTAAVADLRTPGVDISTEKIAADRTIERMHTPWGILTRQVETGSGYGSSWTREHWIKGSEDYRITEQVLRNAEISPTPGLYREARRTVGERGVVLVWTARAPLQRLWIEYTGIQRLAYDLADCPEVVEGVLDAMLEQSREIMRIAAESEAQLIWLPDNITGDIAGPTLFERYLLSYYRDVCQLLVDCDKIPCCHMDGKLRSITDSIGRTDLPVIEAFTPPPDGNLPVSEAAQAWPDKTLWVNFPSSVHLSETEQIIRTTRDLIRQAEDHRGFLIGVTENIPDSVGAISLETIAQVLA